MRDFDTYGVTYCESLSYTCGGTAPRALLLLMAFRNPQDANYCVRWLYVLLIQRWGA